MKRAWLAIAVAACGHSGTSGQGSATIANAHAATGCTAVTYAKSGDGIERIIVHGDQLFTLRSPKTIEIYPLAGGAAKVLEQEESIGDIAVVDNKIIATHYNGGGLIELPLAGGTPRSISEAMDGPHQISPLDHGHYIVVGLTGVYRTNPDASVEKLYASEDSDTDIGASATSYGGKAYVSLMNAILEIGSTGPGEKIFQPAEGLPDIKAAGAHALFVAVSGGENSIFQIDYATHKPTKVAPFDGMLNALAATGDTLYAVVDAQVKRVDGNKLTPVFTAPSMLRQVVVDGDALYYLTDTGLLARACLPHP